MNLMTNTNKTKDDYDLPLLMKKRELVLQKIAHLKMERNKQEDDFIAPSSGDRIWRTRGRR